MQLKQKHIIFRMGQLQKTRWAKKIKKLSLNLEMEKKINYSAIQSLLKKAAESDNKKG